MVLVFIRAVAEKMNTKTLTRADIAESLYNKIGFSHADSFKIIETLFDLIVDYEIVRVRPYHTHLNL